MSTRERHDLAAWLSSLDFHEKHNEICAQRQSGSGDWVFKNNKFKKWRSGHTKTLWCTGIPGSGKTFLTSHIIESLSPMSRHQNDGAAAIYAYCNFKDRTIQTVYNLMGCLLKQLVLRFTTTFERVQAEYRSHRGRNHRPTLNEIHRSLIRELKENPQVFVIIDALDEVAKDETRSELLQRLISLHGHLLVTSRDIASIKTTPNKVSRLEIQARTEDIRKYIRRLIHSETQFTRLNRLLAEDNTLRNEVFDHVAGKAQGMFLLPRLHMGFLATKATRQEIRTALENLPTGPSEVYDDAMRRIHALGIDDRLCALKTVMLVASAFRSLTELELQHALKILLGDTDYDNLVDIASVIDLCAGLVVPRTENGHNVLCIVHYTAHEYFDKYTEWRSNPHAEITNMCLRVLSILSFENSDPGHSSLPSCHVLKHYAGNWGNHARGPVEKIGEIALLEFLKSEAKVDIAVRIACSRNSQPDFYPLHGYHPRDDVPKNSALHLCALFGLTRISRRLISEGYKISRDNRGATPLHIAVWQQHLPMAIVLLNHSPYTIVNVTDTRGRTPLHVAVGRDNVEMVRLLLSRKGIQVNVMDWQGCTPLCCAAKRGDVKSAQLLVQRHDVHVNSQDGADRTPLWYAVQQGCMQMVWLLTARRDINVNLQDKNSRTALWLATEQRNLEIVRFLIARGDTAVGLKDMDGRTPLWLAADQGNVEMVKLLLTKHDIDINSTHGGGWTPLWLAVNRGHTDIVRLLMERDDMDMNSRDAIKGRTPLWLATEKGSLEIMALLMKRHDVDVNAKDEAGRTPLWLAAQRGSSELALLLLSWHDVDINAKDRTGLAPLWLASQQGNMEIVHLLLERSDINVNCQDDIGRTPLWLAAQRGDVEFVQLLLDRDDVDANAKSVGGRSPLWFSAQRGSVEIVQLLLARWDVIPGLKDSAGRTPLFLAAEHGSSETVRLFLARDDVDPDPKDKAGKTPLSVVAERGFGDIVQMLLEKGGINPNTQDEAGHTPLYLAAQRGHIDVVQFLLSRDDVLVHPPDVTNICMPLIFSMDHSYDKSMVKLFLRRALAKLDTDWKDQNGCTPLWIAAWHGDDEGVHLLLALEGIDVNSIPVHRCKRVPPLWAPVYETLVEDNNDLSLASWDNSDMSEDDNLSNFKFGAETVIKTLLSRMDVDVNWRNERGETLLFKAAKKGFESLVKQLLYRDDIDVNLQNEEGDSPLHCAVRSGLDEIVSLLTSQRDITINLKNKAGKTPLHSAVFSQDSHERMLQDEIAPSARIATVKFLLVHSDIDIDIMDKNGLTPLVLARSVNDVDLVNLLDNTMPPMVDRVQ